VPPTTNGTEEGAHAPWWAYRSALLLLVLASAIPMIWPAVPPLTDLPGHMGRYRVELDGATSPYLGGFFAFHWALLANLGVDLLVLPLGRLLGLEPAVKLIVMAIPPLTAAGYIWTAREAHGRVPPTALFALPFAYGYPLMFGFVNFALSMALALFALGLWLRLGRNRRHRLRAALFVPIALLLWVAHIYGWVLLGLAAAATELVAQRRAAGSGIGGWARAFARTAVQLLSLAAPLVPTLLWRGGAAGGSFDWFHWSRKADWAIMPLRDLWPVWDIGSVALAAAVIVGILLATVVGRRRRGTWAGGLEPGLGLTALLLAVAFVLAPGTVFGSAYADMRLVPFAFGFALIAIRPDAWGRYSGAAALAGLAFFAARTAGTTASFALHDRAWSAQLDALHHLPRGARLVTFVARGCPPAWGTPRFDHLPSMAIVRREAFANDQWTMAGAQLLSVRYEGGAFVRDPSQFVVRDRCVSPFPTLDKALAKLPRAGFDYVWLIDPPPYDPRSLRGLRPVWRRGQSALFRVER